VSKIDALVIDDAPLNLKLLSVLLQTNGYAVRTAESAEQALELLAGYSPQLLLVDLRLPGMDGLTLVRTLRREPRHAGLVVVAVTASAMKGDEEVAIAAGCDAYVTKPVNTRTLPAHLAECMAKRKR
jgi:CheY-like chemotaxis protein